MGGIGTPSTSFDWEDIYNKNKGGNMPVPAMAVAAGAGSAMSALGNYLGGSNEREYTELLKKIKEWKFGEGKNLFASLKKKYESGTTIAPGKRASMIGKNQIAMSGAFRRIMAAMGNRGDMRNPALQKMFAQTYMPMEAEFSQKLDMADMSEMSKLRNLLMSSTFGG